MHILDLWRIMVSTGSKFLFSFWVFSDVQHSERWHFWKFYWVSWIHSAWNPFFPFPLGGLSRHFILVRTHELDFWTRRKDNRRHDHHDTTNDDIPTTPP